MNSTKGLGASALNKITPECANIGKTVKMVSIVTLLMIVVAAVLLIAAIIYNYARKTESTDADEQARNEESKRKVIGALTITGTVLVFLASLSSVWDYSVVSKAVNKCIPSAM